MQPAPWYANSRCAPSYNAAKLAANASADNVNARFELLLGFLTSNFDPFVLFFDKIG